MPNWYWEKKDLRNTPSQEKGMDFDTETRYRREGVRFIMELGKALNLSHNTMATGGVYYHRFYMFHSFQEFPRYVTSTCCLFLAGKAEETPKKCRDIVRTVRQLTNDRQFNTFGQDPREELMILERVLLQTIKFDLQVEHPYESIIKFAKGLKGDQNKLQKMVQMSWTFVNDSLCTTLSLQWEPEIIAIAVMYLAVKLSKFEIKDWANRKPHHTHWWDLYVEDLDTPDLEEICHQVLDLYAQPVTAAKEATVSPPPGNAPKPQHTIPKSSKPKTHAKPSTVSQTAQPPPPPNMAQHAGPRPKAGPQTPPAPPPITFAPPPPHGPPPNVSHVPPPAPGPYGKPPLPPTPMPPPTQGYPMGYPPQGYPVVPPGAPPPGGIAPYAANQYPPYPPPGYQQPPPVHGPPPPPHGPSPGGYNRGHPRY